jgi:peptidoglycan L-alanyl-D-glutamate endopeptidase CwlK
MDAEDVPTSRGRRKRSRSKSRFNISQAEDIMGEMKAPWMIVAKALEGEAEMAGKAANPRILEMFRVAGLPDDPAFRSDETAWCAAFANSCLRCGGYQGTQSALASSFAEFGTDLGRTPQPGCVVLFKPMAAGASGHVAFFVADDGDSIKVLGGNQSDQVKVASFSKSKWRAYRWPSQTAPLPETTLPTILSLAPNQAPDHVHAAGAPRAEPPPLIRPAVADNFGRVQPVIEQWEGGYSDDPADPGGATNMGITQEVLREWRHQDVTKDDVKALQRDEARQIYRARYWQPLRCDEMPIALALMTYNAGVNCGIGRGARWLQEALNKQGEGLDVDGEIGPLTLSACARADVTRAVNDFVATQEAFYRSLGTFATFGKGWLNRLTDVKSKALAMASESPAAPDVGDVTEPSHAQPMPDIGDWWRHPSPGPSFDGLIQRIRRVEQMLAAEKMRPEDNPFLPQRDITMPTMPTMPTIPTMPSSPNDLPALIERVMTFVQKVQPPGTTTPTVPGSEQGDQLRRALDLLKTIVAPGTDGQALPLGQVNGALGQTIGKLLNGKKTAIGLLGGVLTPILANVPAASGLGGVLALLTPIAGLSGFALPVFLALTAWGVLGKFEKWSQGTAPAPRVA